MTTTHPRHLARPVAARPLAARPLAAVALAASLTAALAGCSQLGEWLGGSTYSDGPVVDDGNTDVMDLAVGDCIVEPEAASEEGAQIGSIDVVDCAEEHHLEVFQLVEMTMSEYPGDDAVYDLAVEQCIPYFEEYVGTAYERSTLYVGAYTPTSLGWATGDHEAVCMVYNYEFSATGSFRGSGL